MSEQTPNSTEDLNGSEPSMEDILASIRKIISDDEPVALESPEDAARANFGRSTDIDDVLSEFGQAAVTTDNLTSDAVLEAVNSPDSVDLNIDDVLAGLDDDIVSFEAEPPSVELVDHVSDLDLPETAESDPVDDILELLDKDMSTDDNPVEMVELSNVLDAVEAPDLAPEVVVESDDLEMDALLDEILMTPDDEVQEFVPETLAEDTLAPDTLTESLTENLATDEQSDLDLVKSLMADLADDPGEIETGEDLDALLAIPDIEIPDIEIPDIEIPDIENVVEGNDELAALEDVVADEAMESVVPETDTLVEADEDILGDILGMTIEDELQTHEDDLDLSELTSLDDVAAAEQENIIENMIELAPEPIDLEAELPDADIPDELPSLSEIAAAAQADAIAVETAIAPPPIPAAAGITAAAGAGLAAFTANAATSETDQTETQDAEPITTAPDHIIETSTHSLPTQETSMPVKAVKSDTILDEVTETATAGAFAELNQVVEDKAIFNERGPRIGDLVQEALRPMLKEWLDANLKGIVERAVTKEVKRISKGQ